VAAHARLGLNVVVDVGLHDAYSEPRRIVPDAARRLRGLPALLVGVRCPSEVIWQRRHETWDQTLETSDARRVMAVDRWQTAVHAHLVYDLEVDTSSWSLERCADVIVARLAGPPGRGLLARGAP
jgi:chloramphenicol 3-O phosphotransferase